MPPSPYSAVQAYLGAQPSSRVLVLDEALASHLRTSLSIHVASVYPYLAQRAGKQVAGPYSIFRAFRAAWREVSQALGIRGSLSFFELWDFAQTFARDLGEILLARQVPGSQEAVRAYLLQEFRYIEADELIREAFAIREESDLPWLNFLPLPRLYRTEELAQLFRHLAEVAAHFLNQLEGRGQALGEYLLATATDLGEATCLWNVLSPEPLWSHWRQQVGSRDLGWDVSRLATVFGEAVWPSRSFPAQSFPLFEQSTVHIMESVTPLSLLNAAAEAIAQYASSHQVAVWVGEPRYVELLRHLLRQRGLALPEVSPSALSTPAGLQLARSLRAGQIPDPQVLEADEDTTVHRLYAEFYQSYYQGEKTASGTSPTLEALERFIRFLRKVPILGEAPFEGSSVVISTLSGLAGGAYDVLFVLFPPQEPLGSWRRLSFLPLGVRLRYTTPMQHQQMAWRLLSLLLASSAKVYMYRLADAITPVEEFLSLVPERSHIWQVFSVEPVPVTAQASVPPSVSTSIPELSAARRLSPSDLATFLQCPRRYYWKRIAALHEGGKGAALYRGDALHRALQMGLVGPIAPWRARPVGTKRSLWSVRHRWRPQRFRLLYRRVYSRLTKEAPAFSFRNDPEARLYGYLLARAGATYFQHLASHLGASHWHERYRFDTEVWLEQQIAPAYVPSMIGRLDLLIRDRHGTPRLVMDFKTGRVPKLDFEAFCHVFDGHLAWLRGEAEAPPAGNKSKGFSQALQAYAYAVNFSGTPLKLVMANAVIPKDFFYQEALEPTFERPRFIMRWDEALSLLKTWLTTTPRDQLLARFHMTPREESCVYCPYNLLCHRL